VVCHTAQDTYANIAASLRYDGRALAQGTRLVRESEWLTTDHLEARWYRIVDHRSDESQVRLEVTAEPDDEATEIAVVVVPNGYVIAQASAERLGAEAIRIIATATRAA
jgi:hypothetical protein